MLERERDSHWKSIVFILRFHSFEIKIFGGYSTLELFTTETLKTTRDVDDFGRMDFSFGDNMPSNSRYYQCKMIHAREYNITQIIFSCM